MESAEKPGQQRHQRDADESDAAARHELLHPLRLSAGVVVAVTFHEVDSAPDAETGPERHDESLEYAYCGIEESHMVLC